MKPPVDAPRSRQRRPRHVERERVERARELHAAARDVRVVRRAHLDRGVLVDERAGLVDARSADEHLAGEDDGLRARPRRREAARDEELVDAHLAPPPRR